MELCHGNLKKYVEDLVKRKQKIDSRGILSQIVTGLSYLHGHKIIHKDLKPHNILYQQKGSDTLWKLSDFGFARKMRASKEEFSETENLGTAYLHHHASPVLCSGQ
jgi:serine/threonine protein kinase